MDRLGPQLLRLSTAICHDSVAAEDVVQEAFIKLWRKPPDGGARAIPSWLKRVVTNASINVLQRTRRPAKLPDVSYDPALQHQDRVDQRLDLADEVARITHAMDRMPEDKRIVIVLRVQHQMSYAQIAEAMGIPEGTVMSRLNRARKLLAELVVEQDAQSGRAGDESLPFRPTLGQER